MYKEGNTMRKRVLAVFVSLLCVFMLAGCAKKTLEKKISKSDLKELNDNAYEQYVKTNPLFRDIKVEIDGNNLYYKCYLARDLTSDEIMDMQIGSSDLIDFIFQLKDGIEKETGIRPEKIGYYYYGVDDEIVHQVEA